MAWHYEPPEYITQTIKGPLQTALYSVNIYLLLSIYAQSHFIFVYRIIREKGMGSGDRQFYSRVGARILLISINILHHQHN